MKYKCNECGSNLIVSTKHGIGYPVYKCDKCNIYYYKGNSKSKIVVKQGIIYINLNKSIE